MSSIARRLKRMRQSNGEIKKSLRHLRGLSRSISAGDTQAVKDLMETRARIISLSSSIQDELNLITLTAMNAVDPAPASEEPVP